MKLRQNVIPPRQQNITVGQTSVEVCREVTPGQQRTWLTILNNSPTGQIISLSFGGEAVAGTGTVLSIGAAHNEVIDAVFVPQNLRVTAISSAASGVVSIQERWSDIIPEDDF